MYLHIYIVFGSPLLPVLRSIAKSSASLRASGPTFRNLSLGLEESGMSFIFMVKEEGKRSFYSLL
jgi:hypothetical protein